MYRHHSVMCHQNNIFSKFWNHIKFQNFVFDFQTLRVRAQWTHFASLDRVWRLWELFGYHFPTSSLTVFHEENNVDIYLAASAFRTSEICSVRVHWSHPARLGWAERLQNKIWTQNQQCINFRVFVFQINFSFLHSFEKVLLEFPESGRFKTHQNDYSPLWFF